MDQDKKEKIKEKVKIGVWVAIGASILTMIIGFHWAGWVTSSTAKSIGEEMSQAAVVDHLAPVCVAQFNHDAEKAQKYKELKETDSWDRGDYVERQGWATMPYEKKPDRSVADKCAELIIQTDK